MARFLCIFLGIVCIYKKCLYIYTCFPGGSEVKASAYNAGDLGSIPELGRSSGEGNGNSLQYSCLENPMDGGAWWTTVHGVAKSWTRLSNLTLTIYIYIYIYRYTHTCIHIIYKKTYNFICYTNSTYSTTLQYFYFFPLKYVRGYY